MREEGRESYSCVFYDTTIQLIDKDMCKNCIRQTYFKYVNQNKQKKLDLRLQATGKGCAQNELERLTERHKE